MRRSVPLPLICLLALATGVALLGTGAVIAEPALQAGAPITQGAAAAADIALVRRYYAAVNEALRTGDASSLDGVVAVDFVDRTARPGFTPTRDGLVRYLLALRATFPAMRLTPEEPIAQGDSVLARVWVDGVADGEFLGVPLAGLPPTWETHDLFRIAGDRIVERRGAGDWPVLPAPLGQAPLARPPAAAVVRLARYTYAPGARQLRMGDLGPLLLAVEAGTLTAQVDGPAVLTRGAADGVGSPQATTAPVGVDVVLHPGDGLLVSPGVRHAFRNAEQTPTVVLAVTLLPWQGRGAPGGDAYLWPIPGALDITAQLLIDEVAPVLPTEPAAIALGRLALAPQTGLAPYGATGSQFIFVETGMLSLATSNDDAHRSAGSQALVEPGAVATLRNGGDGPLVVLLVTITPDVPETASGER